MKNNDEEMDIGVGEQITYLSKKLGKKLDIFYGDIIFNLRGGRVYRVMVQKSYLTDRLNEDGENINIEQSNFGQGNKA